jgi:hypothetical protein
MVRDSFAWVNAERLAARYLTDHADVLTDVTVTGKKVVDRDGAGWYQLRLRADGDRHGTYAWITPADANADDYRVTTATELGVVD